MSCTSIATRVHLKPATTETAGDERPLGGRRAARSWPEQTAIRHQGAAAWVLNFKKARPLAQRRIEQIVKRQMPEAEDAFKYIPLLAPKSPACTDRSPERRACKYIVWHWLLIGRSGYYPRRSDRPFFQRRTVSK